MSIDNNNDDNLQTNDFVLNTILHGDCLEVIRRIPDNSIDLTVTSPPYDKIRNYKGKWFLNYHALGQELYRVTKDGGVAIIVIGDGTKAFAKSLTTARWTLDFCDNAGWRLFESCVYQRVGNPGAWWTTRFRVDHETILIFLKGRRPRVFEKKPLLVPCKHAGRMFAGTDRQSNGTMKRMAAKTVNALKCRGTIWQYSAANTEGNKLKLRHPATMPDSLAKDAILCFTQPGDLILDPFAGSGTTCVVAAQLGRRFVGIEIAAEYCAIARERLEKEVLPAALPPDPSELE